MAGLRQPTGPLSVYASHPALTLAGVETYRLAYLGLSAGPRPQSTAPGKCFNLGVASSSRAACRLG
jgi:hypothetical protein